MGKNKLSSGLINVVTYDTENNISLNSGSNLLMSLSGSGKVTIPGNLVVLGGISGSSAESSSYALNADKIDNLDSTQLVLTSSFNSYTSSASSSLGSLSSSVATTTSGLAGRITTVEGNYATTGSNTFIGNQIITGSICSTGNIVTTGQIVAQTINVQQVTSSIVYSCGSNTFGCSLINNQVFTGSVFITGSNITANVNNTCFSGNVCAAGNLLLGGTGSVNYIPKYTTSGTLGDSRMTTYGNGGFNINLGWANCNRIGFDNDSTGTYFYGLELDNGTRQLNIIGKAPDGNTGVSIWTGGNTYCQRFNINGSGVATFSCQICTPTTIGGDGYFTSLQSCNSSDPTIEFYRNTCNNNVGIGRLYWYGLNNSYTKTLYSYIQTAIENCGASTFCSRLEFFTSCNGSVNRSFMINGIGIGCFASTVCTPFLATNAITLGSGFTSPSNAGVGYGIFSYTGVGLGISAAATGVNQGMGFFTCGDFERMRLTTSGNLGINSISPCARLHVQGNSALEDLLYFCAGGSVNTKFVYSIASGADDAFVLRRNHTTQGNLCIMSWTYNGYVGINCTTPSYVLDVNGTTRLNGNVGIRITPSSAGDQYLTTGDAGIAYTNTYFGTGQVRVGGGSDHVSNTVLSVAPGVVTFDRPGIGGGALKIDGSGNVSVNNTTATAKFHAYGTTKLENYTYYGYAQSFVWQSVFNNPVQSLFTFNAANAYSQTLIKVTMIQNGVSNGFAGRWSGFALAHLNPYSFNSSVTTMTAEYNPSNISAPVLSWSGQTLQITPNRATNYDGYVAFIEWGSNTNTNTLPTVTM